MSRFFAAVFLVCWMVCPAMAGERRQFGNLIYEVPDDFKVGRADRGYVVLYTDSDDLPFCNIRIYAGLNHVDVPAMDVVAFARAQMKADLIEDEDEQKAIEDVNQGSFVIGKTPAVMLNQKVGGRVQVYLALKLPTRFELLRFDGPAADQDDVKAMGEVLKTKFLPMAESLKAISNGARPLLGPPEPGNLRGVWWGGGLSTNIGLDGMLRLDFVTSTYTFFPTGRFYRGVPEEGIDQFDFEKAVATQTASVGNYTVRGKRIILHYADGDTDQLDLEEDLIIDGIKRLSQCRIPEDGFRFDGEREFVYYQGFAAGMTGGASAWNGTKFTKAGTFEHAGGSGASALFNTGGGFATHSTNELKGTYKVRDGFIELTADNGQPFRRWTILLSDGEDDGKPKTWILVDGDFID